MQVSVSGSSAEAASGPSDVSVSGVGVTSLSLQWGEVECVDRNGLITGYSVRYGPSESSSKQTVTVLSRAFSIDRLLIRTSYSFEVAAVNRNGIGVYSLAVIATTATPTGICLCVLYKSEGY